MTAAEQDARREGLRSLVDDAVEDAADGLIERLAAWLGEDRATDAQVIAFALEALGRRLRERADAERSRGSPATAGRRQAPEADVSAGACPGAGRCHVASWCAECEISDHGPCDARARGERCDRHPASAVTRPQLERARHELACAFEDLGEAERLARVAEREAGRLRQRAGFARAEPARRLAEVDELQASLTAVAHEGTRHSPSRYAMTDAGLALAKVIDAEREAERARRSEEARIRAANRGHNVLIGG